MEPVTEEYLRTTRKAKQSFMKDNSRADGWKMLKQKQAS